MPQLTPEQIMMLELLLGKLQEHIGYKFAIIPAYIQDGTHIGVYKSDGTLLYSRTKPNLSEAINDVKANVKN